MDKQRIELVKGPQETIISLVMTGVSIGILYFTLNPEAATQATEWVHKQQRKAIHHFSVWMARSEIRSLPETDSKA